MKCALGNKNKSQANKNIAIYHSLKEKKSDVDESNFLLQKPTAHWTPPEVLHNTVHRLLQ